MRQVYEFIVQISVVFLKFNKLSSDLIGSLILHCSLNPNLILNINGFYSCKVFFELEIIILLFQLQKIDL